MDSLPTGSIYSWLIVGAIAISPIVALFGADIIGRFRRRKAQARPIGGPAKRTREKGLGGGQ
jgi:hypothetical protein